MGYLLETIVVETINGIKKFEIPVVTRGQHSEVIQEHHDNLVALGQYIADLQHQKIDGQSLHVVYIHNDTLLNYAAAHMGMSLDQYASFLLGPIADYVHMAGGEPNFVIGLGTPFAKETRYAKAVARAQTVVKDLASQQDIEAVVGDLGDGFTVNTNPEMYMYDFEDEDHAVEGLTMLLYDGLTNDDYNFRVIG